MLKKLSVAIAAASSVALGGVAMAETFPSPVGKFDVTMTSTLASDWISRGSSQNNGNPTVQGSLDIAHESGIYVGIWGGSMSGEETTGGSEFDYYLGYAGSLTEDISFDVAVATYVYSGTTWDGENADNDIEYLASVSAYGATIGTEYRTDRTDEQLYYYVGYDLELPGGFGLAASVGQTDLEEEDETIGVVDYVDWSLGLSKTLIGLDFAVVYSSNDLEDAEDNYTFSVSKTF